jgi:putative salt-induced outer membrane protein
MSPFQHLLVGLPWLVCASIASAAGPVADGQWHGALSAGGAAASGNTTSQSLALSADGSKATVQDKISLYGLSNHNRSQVNGLNTTTSNLLRLGGRYDFNLSDRVFAFGGGEYETHKAAGLKSRENANVGVGYRAVRSADASVDVFGGVGYSNIHYTSGLSRDGAELILGEEGNYKISPTTTFKQRLVFYPGSNGLGRRATFDAGLATAISGAWTLNLGLSARYLSAVPVGVKNTDTLLTMGFGYKY